MNFGRQLRYQIERLLLRRTHLQAEGLPYGMKFRFRTPDDVGRHIYKYRTWEPRILEFLERQPPLSAGDLAFDVGANLGWYSVLLDRLANGAARVHAFEPDPVNRALLEQNLVLNQVSRVRVHELALSDREGRADLNRYRAINLGKHTLLDLEGAVDSIPASLSSLDQFVIDQELEDMDVQIVKLDVEGHEPAVVQGGQKTLSRARLLILEYSPMYYQREAARQMLDSLTSAGLRPLSWRDGEWRRCEPEALLEAEEQIDTIWIRGPRGVQSA